VTRVGFALALVLCLALPGVAAATDFQSLAFEPHPGARLPLAERFVDENGDMPRLGQFFRGKPVILVLDYLRCTSLCGLTLASILAALDRLPLDAGGDFQLLAISIDPRDTPADLARAKLRYLSGYHRAGGAGFHFLAGGNGSARRLADAVGFPYRFDAATGQYIHPAGFIVASPDGRISRYILGVATAAAELREALAGAARGEALGPFQRLFLLCHVEGTPLGR
jgi:protein SCO1/2